MNSYGFLGIGAFGGNITRLFEDAGFPCIAANSSTEDLRQITNAKNKLHFKGGSGCHKDRKKAKALLKNNMEILVNEVKAKMPEITTLFISGSAAGGTGSGMLAACARILKNELDINICLITVLPSKSEQFRASANTVEVFQEIEKLTDIGAVFILDNGRPLDKIKINEIFCTHLKALLSNENGSERGCVDRGEINELLRTPGMSVISKLGKDNTGTAKLLASLKGNNIYAPLEADKVIRYLCLMNSSNNNISTEELYSELGTPVDEYIGLNSQSTVCMIAGLSLPKTRLLEIKKTAQANSEIIKNNMAAADESLFGDDVDFISSFDIKSAKPAKKVSSLDIMNEFL